MFVSSTCLNANVADGIVLQNNGWIHGYIESFAPIYIFNFHTFTVHIAIKTCVLFD